MFEDLQRAFEEFIDDPNETPQEAIERGERQFEEMEQTFRKIDLLSKGIGNIEEIKTTNEENKKKMKKSRNDFIDKMIEMYKNTLPREEYVKKRKEWNDKREETEEMKIQREMKELMEDVRSEREEIERIQREVNEKERILKDESNRIETIQRKVNEKERILMT